MHALTLHWICKRWSLHSVVAGVELLDESHTAKFLKQTLQETLERWNLGDKVFAVITDGAANMLASVELAKDDDLVEESMRCVCHTMQCMVTKALEEKACDSLLNKCRKLVTSIRSSQNMMDDLKKRKAGILEELKADPQANLEDERFRSCRLSLIQEVCWLFFIFIFFIYFPLTSALRMQVCTRWSSTYMMLKRLLELREHVTFVISRAKDQKMRDKALTPQEWKDVQQLVLLLGPFAEAVRHWEGQHYVPEPPSVTPGCTKTPRAERKRPVRCTKSPSS